MRPYPSEDPLRDCERFAVRHRALGRRIPSTGEQSPHHQETLCVADTPPAAPPQVSLALPRPPIGRLSPNQPMSEPEGGGIFPQPGICTNGQNLVCAGHCRKLSVFARAALLCRDAKTQAWLWLTVGNSRKLNEQNLHKTLCVLCPITTITQVATRNYYTDYTLGPASQHCHSENHCKVLLHLRAAR